MADSQHITRRVCLKAAPLILVPAVAVAGTPDDETFALIEAHRVAEAAYDQASHMADLVVLGRAPTDEEWAAQDEAGDAFAAAEIALAAYAPPTMAGSRAKAEYILAKNRGGGFDDVEIVGALIRSVGPDGEGVIMAKDWTEAEVAHIEVLIQIGQVKSLLGALNVLVPDNGLILNLMVEIDNRIYAAENAIVPQITRACSRRARPTRAGRRAHRAAGPEGGRLVTTSHGAP